MADLIHSGLETCGENSGGLTLYFEGPPTDEEVRAACRAVNQPLSVDPDDQFFNWCLAPTPVSEKAGLIRVQADPTA